MQIFTELSQNQKDALGKPCTKCKTGTYTERNGRYGPWVQCNNWGCKSKVYRPRGAWVARREVATGNAVVAATAPSAPTSVTAKDIENAVAQIIGRDANQALQKILELKLAERGDKIEAAARREANATLAHVEANANAVLSIVTEGLAELRANKPQVLEVKQVNGNVVQVENGHYLSLIHI